MKELAWPGVNRLRRHTKIREELQILKFLLRGGFPPDQKEIPATPIFGKRSLRP
ncbi:MAG: hypothetical protein JWM28_872 [Chitinophagaceae bacterium]|nr:hypothetical protein [Chitinophagaceae bacterium]